ncbi:hypothetical protein BIW11_09676, partial [Tropilaelaps mercedesae]
MHHMQNAYRGVLLRRTPPISIIELANRSLIIDARMERDN